MKYNVCSITSIGLFSGLLMLSGNNYAETAEAGQSVSVNVSKTLLIDVEDTSISIVYNLPVNAGDTFSTRTITPDEDISIALTSNVSTAKLYAKATILGSGEALSNFNLKLSTLGIGGVLGPFVSTDLTDNDIVIGTVGNHVSGNLASSASKLRILGGLADTSAMPPYGTYNAIITYTLKEN